METELQRVRAIRNDGATWQVIGDSIGLTRQGAISRYGALLSDIPTPKEKKDTEWIRQSAEISTYLQEYGPFTRDTIMERYNISPYAFAQLDIPRNLIVAPSKPIPQKWSDADVKAHLRRANRETDGPELTTKKYLEWYADQPKNTAISLPRILQRFDYWNAALDAANVRHGKRQRTYTRSFTTEDVLTAVGAFVEAQVEAGAKVTYSRYDEAQKDHDDWPSGSTARNLSGLNWLELVAQSASY